MTISEYSLILVKCQLNAVNCRNNDLQNARWMLTAEARRAAGQQVPTFYNAGKTIEKCRYTPLMPLKAGEEWQYRSAVRQTQRE